MESLTLNLSKLSYEMTCYEVLSDLLCLCQYSEDRDYIHLLAMFDMDYDDSEESLELVLMNRICEIEDEGELVNKIVEVVNLLMGCSSVTRPYEQHFVTSRQVWDKSRLVTDPEAKPLPRSDVGF